jgi:hypothetical protein
MDLPPGTLFCILKWNPDGKVVHRAEKAQCRSFPVPGDKRLRQGVKRNFEVFDPLDFIAEITQHIPDQGAQQVRYYGWYSNASRGRRAKAAAPAAEPLVQPVTGDDDSAYRKRCRMGWAAPNKRVYEVDPLRCPVCEATMRIVAFIERRGPPAVAPTQDQLGLELHYVDPDEFLAAL